MVESLKAPESRRELIDVAHRIGTVHAGLNPGFDEIASSPRSSTTNLMRQPDRGRWRHPRADVRVERPAAAHASARSRATLTRCSTATVISAPGARSSGQEKSSELPW